MPPSPGKPRPHRAKAGPWLKSLPTRSSGTGAVNASDRRHLASQIATAGTGPVPLHLRFGIEKQGRSGRRVRVEAASDAGSGTAAAPGPGNPVAGRVGSDLAVENRGPRRALTAEDPAAEAVA